MPKAVATTNTPTTLARRRHARAAPGALDRRCARLLRQPVTTAQRARIERDVELLIAMLDAIDGDTDREAEHEGCCDAGDDDPASSYPFVATGGKWGPGDPADGEESDPGEPTCENEGEPSLGWTSVGASSLAPSQTAGTKDLEGGADEAEPDYDGEPLCGPHTPARRLLGDYQGMPA